MSNAPTKRTRHEAEDTSARRKVRDTDLGEKCVAVGEGVDLGVPHSRGPPPKKPIENGHVALSLFLADPFSFILSCIFRG